MRTILIEEFLDSAHHAVSSFSAALHGIDAHNPSIQVQSALTFARQCIGWNGKFTGGTNVARRRATTDSGEAG